MTPSLPYDDTFERSPLRNVRDRAYDVLVHGSILLGVATIGEVYVASSLANVGPNAALLSGLLATVGVYNLDKLADLDVDEINYAERTKFISAHPRAYALFSGAALVGAVVLAVGSGGLRALGLTLFPGVVAVAYSFPILPSERVRRLKDVLLVNTAVVSLAWAVPVAFVPVAVAASWRHHVSGAVVAATWFFLRSAISVEVHNARDVAGDREVGVDTLPTAVGVPRTQQLLYVADVLSFGLVAAAAALGGVPIWAPLALAPAVVFSVWVTRSLSDSEANVERLCTLRDGEGFLMAVGVAVVATAVRILL